MKAATSFAARATGRSRSRIPRAPGLACSRGPTDRLVPPQALSGWPVSPMPGISSRTIRSRSPRPRRSHRVETGGSGAGASRGPRRRPASRPGHRSPVVIGTRRLAQGEGRSAGRMPVLPPGTGSAATGPSASCTGYPRLAASPRRRILAQPGASSSICSASTASVACTASSRVSLAASCAAITSLSASSSASPGTQPRHLLRWRYTLRTGHDATRIRVSSP